GNIQIAIDAIHAAGGPHHFLSVTKQSVAAIVETAGNPYCHIILRGASSGPNYDKASVEAAAAELEAADLPGRVMVDASHGNSQKNHQNQPKVVEDLAGQISAGSKHVFGLMIESNLVEGNQRLTEHLTYGQSITDACIGWEDTERVLEVLADAVAVKRGK